MKLTEWAVTEDAYGVYKTRTNEHGIEEKLVEYKQKYWDENPPKEDEPQPPTIEEQLADRDRQIIELKKMQNVTGTAVSEISTTLQELIEYTMEMGNM